MVNQYSKTVITLFFFSSIFQDYAQTVFINEISLCNISKELDPDFDYRGWIELYNASENDIDLNNLYFSDELGMPLKYRLFNKRIIPRKGYASIWINGEITDGGIKELDTDPDGGYISISDKNGKIIDDITYPKQITNVSWGRTFDGGADFDYFINSTYNNSNNDSNTASLVVSEPTFSIKGGFYSTSVSVSIDCRTEGSKIYYTLDGSDPTPKKNLYKGNPIIISKTHPLRAKAYADGYLDSRITTATYMINERIPNLPVIFLTTDTINLYNDSIGIYCIGTNGINVPGSSIIANYARDWTRPAHFEYLDKNDTIILSQPVGISISGNASRKFDQKSLQVNSGKKYGKNRFDYPFFNDKKGCRIKSILLRNGGQMNGPGFFKDALLQSMTDILGIDHQAYETSVVYINGIYWGLLNIRERHNKDYIYSNYGYSDEIIDMIENNWREQVVCGDMIAYNKMKDYILNNDLSDNSRFEKVNEMIDIESYINYMCTEIFLINNDWPTNNQILFRNKNSGRFRWILQDLDKSFSLNSGNKLKDLINSTSSSFPEKMITYLLSNAKFKEQYINAQCLIAGSIFCPSRGNLFLNDIKKRLDSEWPYHAVRWGFSKSGKNTFYDAISDYNNRFTTLQSSIFNNIAENFGLEKPLKLFITSNEPSAKISFNALELPALPYEGMYFKNKELKLATPEFINGKKFQYWVIKRDNIEYHEEKRSFPVLLNDSSTSIIAFYDYADSVRRKGLYINEISASNAIYVDNEYKYEDWIEIYNASDKAINLAGHYISNNINNIELFQFSSSDSISTTIPANGHRIIWCSKNIQRGVLHANFKLAKEGGILFLSKKNNNGITVIIDSLSYYAHSEYSSFGRYPDGDASIYLFEKPTFCSTNISSSYNTLQYNQKHKLVYGLEEITPPIVADLKINNGNTKTPNLLVSITYKASENAVYYRISESPDFADATWKIIEKEISFRLTPKLGKKTLYIQLKNARFESNIISNQIELVDKKIKVVMGLNGKSTNNSIELINEEILNNVSLIYSDSYSPVQLFDVWGKPTMKLAKNTSDINNTLNKYGITGITQKLLSNINPLIKDDELGEFPSRFYSTAYFFKADSALPIETRRLIAGFIEVPNGLYNIRLLASQNRQTQTSDFQSYRYQVNNSDIFIPDSDMFYNNQNNFIEFKNVTVEDNTLLICSWREPFGSKYGYYAPMNLIEISESNLTNYDIPNNTNETKFYVYSSKGKLIIENNTGIPINIYGIDGMIIKNIIPEIVKTEIYLEPGIYIINGNKAIVY